MTAYNDQEKVIIALDSVIGLEYKFKRILLERFEPCELIGFSSEVYAFAKKLAGDSKANTLRNLFDEQYLESCFSSLKKNNVVAVTYKSSLYPKKLKEIATYPLVLYCRGNLDLLNTVSFAIVGSRKTLPYALNFAKNVSEQLSASGVTVVTGSAFGADSAVIAGALESGRIISVIAHGHNAAAETNKDLIDKVCRQGLVISEYVPETQARAWMYPVRNRVIAGLADGCLIVSGEKKSGARYTADYSLEFNRDVYALPYSLGIKSGELPNELIKGGAMLCDGADCILDNLQFENKVESKALDLSANELSVFQAIKDGCETVDGIMAQTKFKIFELAPILSSLELSGAIVKLLGNKYKAIK
ncbi:MAG: DNA-processing protein DprA [Christensenellaceae bacterium]